MEPHMAAQRNQNFLFATTEGHSSDIGTTEFWGSHLGPQQQRLNGAPTKLSPFLSLGWARGTGMSMAHTTAHALPSGDGEKMKIGHPKNDPRPSFRRTRKHNSIANPPFTRKENLSLVSSGGAQGGPIRAREPQHNNPYSLGSRRGSCSHMPPRTSMANITAHALPSGDGEKMKIGHPTNDPRPSFRRSRKHNSIANPPFTRKENLPLVSSEGTRESRANELHERAQSQPRVTT